MGECATGACCTFKLSGRPPREVQDMLIPLGAFPEGASLPNGNRSTGGVYYTCRHLTAEKRCAIYATRPEMCRRYPNGRACPHAGCTYSEVGAA